MEITQDLEDVEEYDSVICFVSVDNHQDNTLPNSAPWFFAPMARTEFAETLNGLRICLKLYDYFRMNGASDEIHSFTHFIQAFAQENMVRPSSGKKKRDLLVCPKQISIPLNLSWAK